MTTIERSPTAEATPDSGSWGGFTATLEATPYRLNIGDTVEVTGYGFQPGDAVGLFWHSAEGRYELDGRTEFVGQRYDPVAVLIGADVANEVGQIRVSFEIPDDFGGPHDVRARVAGIEVGQTGVVVLPRWSMTPTSGPLGTLVELRIEGVDIRIGVNTWQVLWDNRYFGAMTAVTTDGVAVARFRAAGPVGRHFIQAWNNSYNSAPYLAWDTAPFRDWFDSGVEFIFDVTEDAGAPLIQVDDFSLTDSPWDPGIETSGRLWLSRDRGTVGEPTTLFGTQLPANAALDLFWTAARGDRVSTAGIHHETFPFGTVRTGSDGRFEHTFPIPDDLGGNHFIEARQGDDVMAVTGLVILPSAVSCTERARVGDRIDIHINGISWSTIDNTYTVTYDNAFIGYVCGFSTFGDVKFSLTATGAPGTHLIDLYPTIYKGKDEMPKVYSVPQLTYADDHPQRRTPAIRFSVQIDE
jgi:hypothetical protein